MSRISCRSPAFAILAMVASTISHLSLAQEQDTAVSEPLSDDVAISIGAQPLATALQEFSEQSGLQVAYVATLAQNVTSQGARDAATPVEALAQILDSTGLEYQFVNADTVAIGLAAAADNGGDSDPGNRRTAGATPRSVMMAQAAVERNQASRRVNEGTEEITDDKDEKPLEEIVVTGTLIRGIAPESSPLDIYTREDILKSGVTTTEQFIRRLPQNFGGSTSEFAVDGYPNDDNASADNTAGSGANLRGLGSDATLVLLNGNRMAPTSTIGNFVDLSMIPVSALDRIDVLTDGASSIYGGDAVAGVINFVLRDDFEGSETAVRYGVDDRGDMKEYRVSQTLGAQWGSGNVLGSYEFFKRDNLALSDRPEIAAPVLTDGAPLGSPQLFDLLPEHERHSALVALKQDISPKFRLSTSGLFSHRNSVRNRAFNNSAQLTNRADIDQDGLTVNVGAEYDIVTNWTASIDGTYSKIKNDVVTTNSLGGRDDTSTSSDVATLDLILNGRLFELPGGTLKFAVGGHIRDESFTWSIPGRPNERDGSREVTAAFGELQVPLVSSKNAVPLVERLEINVSARVDDYSDFGSTANPKFGLLWMPAASWKVRSTYSESFTPPPLGRVGDPTFTGSILPVSFIAQFFGLEGQHPELEQTELLGLQGISRDLEPQTSRAFTAGIEFESDRHSNRWDISVNFYDIEFEGRIGTVPIPQNQNFLLGPFIALADPNAFPPGAIIFSPTQAEVDSLIESFSPPVTLLLGATGTNVGVITTTDLSQNLALTKTRGLDFNIAYARDTDFGVLSGGFNANNIIDFKQQAAVTSPEVDVLNSLYNPVGLKLRARLSLVYDQFSANFFANYTDSYVTDSSATGEKIGSWKTGDVNLAYDFDASSSSLLNRAQLNLSITNIFDEDPPSTPSLGGFRIAGYDPANASPIGRFVALEVRKAF